MPQLVEQQRQRFLARWREAMQAAGMPGTMEAIAALVGDQFGEGE